MSYTFITAENIDEQHLCCAISDKKHQAGVECKKAWIRGQFSKHHTFYKLNDRGKVFIEYTDGEEAWASVAAPGYLYIHCLWVSGSFKGKGYSSQLLNYCIEDAKKRGKSGVCVMSGTKKLPFLSDKKHLEHYGFVTADRIDDYELMAYVIDKKVNLPKFSAEARQKGISDKGFTIYSSAQCPCIANCIEEIRQTTLEKNIDIKFIEIKSKEEAQQMPCVFNNFAVFYNGKFVTHHLLNGKSFEKLIEGVQNGKQ